MHYTFDEMNDKYASIVVTWKYDGEYSVYDIEHKKTDIEEMYKSDKYDCFVAVNESNELVGFLECSFNNDLVLEMSNFLRPDLTGTGIGTDFVSECIDFAVEFYNYEGSEMKLYVYHFNERAIKVYERVGFTKTDECDEWSEMTLEL